jgi:hypothetical protein
MDTYYVVRVLFAKHQVEFRVGISFFILRLKEDHNTVLQKVVELYGIGI